MTGSEMKQSRKRAGLTLAEVGVELGIHAQTVYRLERADQVKKSYVVAFEALMGDELRLGEIRGSRSTWGQGASKRVRNDGCD
jgi:transcriptional regulator with XRE-family HTH domain